MSAFEGKLEDSKGEAVECSECVWILTTNVGSDEIVKREDKIRKDIRSFADIEVDLDKLITPLLETSFPKEFVGRISKRLYFLPFDINEKMELAKSELNDMRRTRWKEGKEVIIWSDAVVRAIAEKYSTGYGARYNPVLSSLEMELALQITSTSKVGKEDKNLCVLIMMENNMVKFIPTFIKLELDRVKQ